MGSEKAGILFMLFNYAIDWFLSHWRNLIIVFAIMAISLFFWLHFKETLPRNEIVMEIFKAIFLASIVGILIEGISKSESSNKFKNCDVRQACCGVRIARN